MPRSTSSDPLVIIIPRPVEFILPDPSVGLSPQLPFPIPDRLSPEGSRFHVPFRLNSGEIAHFELPLSTLR